VYTARASHVLVDATGQASFSIEFANTVRRRTGKKMNSSARVTSQPEASTRRIVTSGLLAIRPNLSWLPTTKFPDRGIESTIREAEKREIGFKME
jgi:hypothetical protein